MTAHPFIRIEPLGVEAANLRPTQQAIRVRYGPRYHLSEECLRDVAALWGVLLPSEVVNDAGVFAAGRVIEHRAGRCKADIRLVQAPWGLWAMDTCYRAALCGGGAAPCVWNPIAFQSEADAKAAGLHGLIATFGGIAAAGGSDAADARRLVGLLKAERTPQLSLF